MESNSPSDQMQTKVTLSQSSDINLQESAIPNDQAHIPLQSVIATALLSFLSTMRRHIVLMFFIVLFFFLLAVISAVKTQPMYQASMLIKFYPSITTSSGTQSGAQSDDNHRVSSSVSPSFLHVQSEIFTNNGFLSKTFETLSEHELQTLRSHRLVVINQLFDWIQPALTALATRFDIGLPFQHNQMTKAVDFSSSLDVSVDPKQSTINITTFSHNPDVAVQMLNLLTKQYNYLRIQDQLKDEKLIKDEVDKISLSIKSAIEKKEFDIDAYIKKHALISTEEYEKRLKELTDLEAKDEVSLDRLRKQKVGLSATKVLAIDPQMDKLLALKKVVESNYQQKIIDFKPKHPEILKLQEQMNNINYQISNIKTKAIQGIQSKINYLENNINNTQKEIQLLVQSKQRLQENDKQLVLYQNELNYLKNQLSSTNDYYKNVFNLQTLDFPIVTFDMQSPAITLTDKVTILNNFYLLLLIGAVTAVGMVTIIHVRGVTYHNSSQIEEIHNIPVLADVMTDHIALLKTSTKADIETLLADIDADYKLLSNSIFYSNENGHPKVICCTSVVNDEHDWMTAAGLAITFAKQNRQVLLIDTHLKQPIINDIFHLSNDAGLTNILVSGDSPINSTQQTMVHNLHIIATGPSPANTSKLLAGVKMNEFLNNARDAFDIIILYAPAIQPKPDLLAIAKYADEIVISTFIGKTRQNQLRTALRKLISANVNPLGVVFNKKMPIGYKVWKRTQEWSKNKQLITAKKDNG